MCARRWERQVGKRFHCVRRIFRASFTLNNFVLSICRKMPFFRRRRAPTCALTVYSEGGLSLTHKWNDLAPISSLFFVLLFSNGKVFSSNERWKILASRVYAHVWLSQLHLIFMMSRESKFSTTVGKSHFISWLRAHLARATWGPDGECSESPLKAMSLSPVEKMYFEKRTSHCRRTGLSLVNCSLIKSRGLIARLPVYRTFCWSQTILSASF